MSLPENYLDYPARRYGMDHDRYNWSDMFARKPIAWPGGTRIALSIVTHVQHFPLDMPAKPFKAPGALSMPYPDFRYFTNRDYGNRIGVFRILRLLADKGLQTSFAVNGCIATRYPALLKAVVEGGHEVVAHGLDMGKVHHSGLSVDDENAIIAETLRLLRGATGQPVEGWLSPGRAQGFNTPELLTRNGIRWNLDWANDDLPYPMRTTEGALLAMPLAYETDDRVVANEYFQSEPEWVQQVKDRFDVLYRESADYGGRVMSLPLHSWVSGMPYRVEYLREVLDYILGHDGVWTAPVGQIAAAAESQV
ncbi:polysaccharide deacetylase family protein [Paracoccus aerius]|uniref:Chitooligosaccharide deacetylase n=1 Tax=Paracoccus aerius TaxID=1915382 RepID=A0ABS1S836_9RHOB|nr:polysaccharide deacetylase family protein [Paracoccus aerius]MBL3673822.1 polysaccharide deacetylase family protein [Paracoccus aerius]GHG32356.1 polysaccharide deacetylase [Paracoccus aerius]